LKRASVTLRESYSPVTGTKSAEQTVTAVTARGPEVDLWRLRDAFLPVMVASMKIALALAAKPTGPPSII
jgi:hypothetical protein